MRVFVATLALALAAGSASASQLDFIPSLVGPSASQLDNSAGSRTLFESSGPIRHRRPRDRELVNDGRDAVGMTVGIPKRQAGKEQGPKDELDKLTDALDALDIP